MYVSVPICPFSEMFGYKTAYSSVSMIRKEKICSSWLRAASTLFYTKRSRVSQIGAITDTDTADEKRTGEVPTYDCKLFFMTKFKKYKTTRNGDNS